MLNTRLNSALAAAVLFTAAAASAAETAPAAPKPDESPLAVLKSDASQKAKADACMKLGLTGTAEAVGPLAALLTDEKLSDMARYGLETIPGPAVNAALREALGKVKGRLLAGVIGSLGVRKDPQAVAPLSALLKDADPVVAEAAARALGRIATTEAIDALMAALPGVPAGQKVAFFEGTFRAAESLAAAGKKAESAALYEKLRALPGAQQDRVAALRGALAQGGSKAEALLRGSLHSEDFLLVAAAVGAAMDMPAADAARILAAEAGSLGPDARIQVLQVLARTGNRAAAAPLAEAARTGPKPVRVAAIRSVAELSFHALDEKTAAGIGSLALGLLDDPDREVAQAAQECVAALPDRFVSEDIKAMFKSGDTARRLTAIDLISRRRMTSSIPQLLEAASDQNAPVRQAALRKVGDLGTAADIPVLLSLLGRLKDARDLDVIEQALSDLCGKVADSEATVAMLTGQMQGAGPAQQAAMLRLLSGAGGAKALKTVRAAVDSPNPDIHATAIRALGAWKTPDAAPELLALAKAATKPVDKILCLRGYLTMASQSEQPAAQRLEMCSQALPLVQSNDEKKMFLGAVSGISSVNTLPLIMPYLENAALKDEAGAAIVAVSEKLLRGQGAAKAAPKLAAPLEKVIEITTNEGLAKRAKAVLATAKTKAGAK